MAWLSVGNSNEDLVDKMCGHGVMVPGRILDAFRHTDRGDFVQQNHRYVRKFLLYIFSQSVCFDSVSLPRLSK